MRAELFVYGTLRHDEPEHRAYCHGVVGWTPARVRGRVYRLKEGWLLLVVPADDVIFDASADPEADEARRAASDVVECVAPHEAQWPWVHGELLRFDHHESVWPPIDAWECFEPSQPGVYRRAVIPVVVESEPGFPAVLPAWAYAATEVPEGAEMVEVKNRT